MSPTSVFARHFRSFIVAAIAAAAPISLSAQVAATDAVAPASDVAAPALPATTIPATATIPTTPEASGTAVSVMYQRPSAALRTTSARADAASQQQARQALAEDTHVGAGQNVALMVVGAAGLLTGLIVGGGAGTAIAVGGAVIGLYGLYKFVQ